MSGDIEWYEARIRKLESEIKDLKAEIKRLKRFPLPLNRISDMYHYPPKSHPPSRTFPK